MTPNCAGPRSSPPGCQAVSAKEVTSAALTKSRSRQWQEAASMLVDMPQKAALKVDAISQGAAVTTMAEAKRWRSACQLLQRARAEAGLAAELCSESGLRVSIVTFGAAARACAAQSAWEQAADTLVVKCRSKGLQMSEPGAAIAAESFRQGMQWMPVLLLLDALAFWRLTGRDVYDGNRRMQRGLGRRAVDAGCAVDATNAGAATRAEHGLQDDPGRYVGFRRMLAAGDALRVGC
eukprot:TRINITY_DN90816_c0_g1_i1.p1 TRINITY_DN90816_c0_g1~~TRINITY_DN90816_c0_g1_i1.p1  ORF type:complete len:256 (-),score=53.58 TRINITY_DN90816_c0_g1_i1:40-747(-)